MNKTLFLIDDHVMVRNGLKNWLEVNTDWKITGEAACKDECINLLSKTTPETYPDIMIVDVRLENETTGFDLINEVKVNHPKIKYLVYTSFDYNYNILNAKESGANGFISKSASEQNLVEGLNKVAEGAKTDFYLEEKLQKSVESLEAIFPFLTRQEKRVLEQILKGHSNEQISNNLFLTVHSVENYVSRLYDKLGVSSRADIMQKFN